MNAHDSLPDDVETLKRLLLARKAELPQARAEASSAEALITHLRLAGWSPVRSATGGFGPSHALIRS
jgi:hypothetical protein